MPARRNPAQAFVTDADVKKVAQIKPELNKTPVVDDEGYDPTQIEEETPDHIQEFLPTDVISSDEYVYVRNNTHGIVRFIDSYKADEVRFNILLEPAGKEGSIQLLENLRVLKNPGFQKWWRQGKVTVSNDPSLAVQLDRFSDENIEVERLQQNEVERHINRMSSNTLPIPEKIDFSFLKDQG